ncbi:DUF2969 domain-containing protein [Enterococcus pallens]|uniref:DUF2969 family protein n=1 Tax=Enterococcus pallens ATCC BAA-351 TaxID=1158607 RepID=R2S1B4_9ENTE|nr:DUF2969 domain-containing protein [Enterococcus pallens]EOH86616.1 hypothetical protein UAU_05059 [Enterococcus pallens ATCC BAA-351]EOU18412.1 hypothetical protein I588_03404 [Enterococcus pallens ATCC BAA-351]
MAKKNKDIQVQIQDAQKQVNGKTIEVIQLVIGKKIIGELIPDGKNFQIFVDGNSLGAAKSLDDGIEAVIRNWNLHD